MSNNVITPREFLMMQPYFPEHTETDPDYLRIANKLLRCINESEYGRSLPEGLDKKIALTLTDYMQDIVADAGLWRAFIEANRALYGWSIPFHNVGEDYIDYELNREDVCFLCWYVIAMLWEDRRDLYPHDSALLAFADECFSVMEEEYDEAPVNEKYNIARGLDLKDPEDSEAIYHLGRWLFLHSYLLTPAFTLTLHQLMQSVDMKDPDADSKLNEAIEQAMLENTTGPLALFTPEWVYLIINGELPESARPAKDSEALPVKTHPYYEKFVEATGGSPIAFFDSYEAMNTFFIEALGWEKNVEHLSQAKGAHDYVLMVNPKKGMLMARDIARCIAAPGNPLYDEDFARTHAFYLLSVRGLCPGDLLQYIFKNNWLPDAMFPGSDDADLVHDNRDFIARCYLQFYYRGD
ncbi:MAG: DUF3843 family protein [Muribaculaceae bacterium]|nr:DUF3843 family protein [Muribaculaceae bacterium]